MSDMTMLILVWGAVVFCIVIGIVGNKFFEKRGMPEMIPVVVYGVHAVLVASAFTIFLLAF